MMDRRGFLALVAGMFGPLPEYQEPTIEDDDDEDEDYIGE